MKRLTYINRLLPTESVLYIPVLLLLSPFVYSDSKICDTSLYPTKDELGYQWRPDGGICEGLYEAEVSGSLEVVSYLTEPLSFDTATHKVLTISIPTENPNDRVPVDDINLRAVALNSGTYYQMDANVNLVKKTRWSLNKVVERARLTSKDLGVFGWYKDGFEKIYLPLHVSPLPGSNYSAQEPFELKVRPTVSLEFVVWRAITVASGPDHEREIVATGESDKMVRAGSPFSILIPSGRPELLDIEIVGKERRAADKYVGARVLVVRPGASP